MELSAVNFLIFYAGHGEKFHFRSETVNYELLKQGIEFETLYMRHILLDFV